jgi:hypothetical protein
MRNTKQLAALIRHLFCQELVARGDKRLCKKTVIAYDGGRDRHGILHESIWDKVAEIVVSRQIDPAVYVCSCFCNLTRFPTPNDIRSPAVAARCEAYLFNLPTRLITLYSSGLSAVYSSLKVLDGLAADESVKTAMALRQSTQYVTSKLLQYCFAVAAGCPDIADPLYSAAVSELALHPDAYRQAWPAGFIPEEIYTAARQRREQFNAMAQ